jgi:hypothetical protein
MEVVEDMDTNHPIDTNKMDMDNTNITTLNVNDDSKLWDCMTKQENEKAKCNICGVILSRKNGATTGLRKHLYQVHKLKPFGITSPKSRSKSYHLSIDEKKKLDSLIIRCVIEDGRSFSDMRQSGILKVFNHLVQGKKNTMYFIIFIIFYI